MNDPTTRDRLSGNAYDNAARGPLKNASNGRGLFPNEATEPSENELA